MTSTRPQRLRLWIPIGILLFLMLLAVVWVAARLTGTVNYYRAASGAMAPQLPAGERFFTSNLRKPERGDAVCFRHYDSASASDQTFIFRLYGLPGDTVVFRLGELLIDGRPAAPAKWFKYPYIVPTAALTTLQSRYDLSDADMLFTGDAITVLHLQPHQAADRDVQARRDITAPDDSDEHIAAAWGHAWNADNFGPAVVPPGHWFLVGDNRRNSLASRYLGFIPQDAYIATVLRDPVR